MNPDLARATASALPGSSGRAPLPAATANLGRLLALMVAAFVGLGLLDGAGGALWSDVIGAFGVSKGVFGLLSGLGLAASFPILLLGGRLTDRFDKRSLVAASFVAMALASLGLLVAAGGAVTLAVLLLLRGLGIGLLDLANNALAMDYERETGRHVMSPLHAGFSGGTMAGAGLVWAAFAAGFGFRMVYLGLTVIFLALLVSAVRLRRAAVPSSLPFVAVAPVLTLGLLKRPDIRMFAVICGVAFAAEALVVQWVAIYLREERGFSGQVGAYAVGAYGLAMLIGRIANGLLTARIGEQAAVMAQGLATVAGGVLVVAGGPAPVAIAGCGLAGLGLAGIVPIVLSLAGASVPGATGAASGATLAGGYLGFAGGPLLAGLTASLWSTRAVMAGVVLAGLLVTLTALRLPLPGARTGQVTAKG